MDKNLKNNFPVWHRPGVLTGRGEAPQVILGASASVRGDRVNVLELSGDIHAYPTDDLTVDPRTARMEFVSEGTQIRIREFRETDGSWLSIIKTDLPIEALRAFTTPGEDMDPEEALDAYALDDSAYIVGLVYHNGLGNWSRVDGDWIALSPEDKTFEDMEVISIDPERAQAFINLYDKSFVTITDAEKYESAASATAE